MSLNTTTVLQVYSWVFLKAIPYICWWLLPWLLCCRKWTSDWRQMSERCRGSRKSSVAAGKGLTITKWLRWTPVHGRVDFLKYSTVKRENIVMNDISYQCRLLCFLQLGERFGSDGEEDVRRRGPEQRTGQVNWFPSIIRYGTLKMDMDYMFNQLSIVMNGTGMGFFSLGIQPSVCRQGGHDGERARDGRGDCRPQPRGCAGHQSQPHLLSWPRCGWGTRLHGKENFT